MKIFRYFLISGVVVWTLASLLSCGSQPKVVEHTLEAKPVPQQHPLILARIQKDGRLTNLDTLETGIYRFAHRQPDLYFLTYGKTYIPLVLGDKDVEVRLDTNDIRHSLIQGGAQNDSLQALYRRLDSLENIQKNLLAQMRSKEVRVKSKAKKAFFDLENRKTAMQYEFIQHNPNLAGVMILTSLTYQNNKEVDYGLMLDTYAQYPKQVKNTQAGKFLTYRLNKVSVGQVGTRAPNFSAPTPGGDTISLFSVLGKVTIVDFWASWCGPCRKNNPDLVRLYQKYHSQGLNIIGVSLDRSKKAWLKAIDEDKLTWYQVSHLRGWEEPIAKQYHIRYIPQTLLLDKTGKIRAKNLRGRALEKKIKELLDE